MQNGNSTHFPSLCVTDENAQFCKEEIKAFAQNLHHDYEEMERQFSEVTDLGFSEKLLRNPFDIDTSDFRLKKDDIRAKLQTELLELQCNMNLQSKAPTKDASGN